MTLPVLLSDNPGLDWREWYRGLMEGHSWTPRQIAEDVTVPQLFALFGEGKRAQSLQERYDAVNRLRARKGLPPLEIPAGQAEEEARRFIEEF